MTNYHQPLWGYKIDLPKGWIHKTIQDTEGFAKTPAALQSDYQGPDLGHLLIRGEWNWSRKPIGSLWNQHITKLSVMLGAKKLGSAPWKMVAGQGFEAEILLPKKTNRRLWVGILSRDAIILHLSVTHWKDERTNFEPTATKIIRSLRFIEKVKQLTINEKGCPIPPDYIPAAPKDLLIDIEDTTSWQSYKGHASIGALQAFFLRELPIHDWVIEEYIPYPADSNLGFARIKINKLESNLTIGLLPTNERVDTANIIIKTS